MTRNIKFRLFLVSILSCSLLLQTEQTCIAEDNSSAGVLSIISGVLPSIAGNAPNSTTNTPTSNTTETDNTGPEEPPPVLPGHCSDGGPNTVLGKWQRCPGGRRSLGDAKAYCENLEIDGATGWRLPSKTELKSLVVCTNGTPTPLEDYPDRPYNCGIDNSKPYERPTIDDAFECGDSGYWTSTYYGTGAGVSFYWYVSFSDGNANYHSSETTFYVRCVR